MALATPSSLQYLEVAPSERRLPAPSGLRARVLPEDQERVVALSYPLPQLVALHGLSDGEAAVALLALYGHSNAEIAYARAAATRTVANQLASAYRKLGGVSRARLAANANGSAPEITGAKRALWQLTKAIYRPEVFEQLWLQSLADAAYPPLGQGLGVAAWVVDLTPEGGSVRRVANACMPRGALDGLVQAAAQAPAFLRAFHGRELCSLRDQLRARDTEALAGLRILRANGARDMHAIVAREGDTAIGIGALVSRSERNSQLEQAHHGRIVEHLRARLRLRAAEQKREACGTNDGEAVHSPAERVALRKRDQLRLAAITSETVSALQAEQTWTFFTQGQLRLCDSFDSVGRRFMLLRAKGGEGTRPLISARQTKIVTMRAAGLCLKEIAHELDVSIATVALELGKTTRALGLRRASELGRLKK